MTNRVIKIKQEGAVWRVSFSAGESRLFTTRAAALASALGRACADDGRGLRNIEINVIAEDEPERTAVSSDRGAVRMDWLS